MASDDPTTGGVFNLGGPPPGDADEPKAEANPADDAGEPKAKRARKAKAADAPEGETEVERLKRELAEKDRLLGELAEQGVEGQQRAASLILPKAYKIRSAVKRHPKGSILEPGQFPAGVLDRMKREGRVTPVFNLPRAQAAPAESGPVGPARSELSRAEDAPGDDAE